MSQILDSMSQSAVVSYPQVLQQLSTESSEEAKDSQVSVILSQGLKQSRLLANAPDVAYYVTLPLIHFNWLILVLSILIYSVLLILFRHKR